MSDRLQIVEEIKAHTREDGAFQTAIPRLQLVRKSRVPGTRHVMDSAKLCYVAQGSKAVFYGGQRLVYGTDTILVLPISVPLIGELVSATPSKPMLSVSMSIDLKELSAVLEEAPELVDGSLQKRKTANVINPVSEGLLNAIARYVCLLRDPPARPNLTPPVRREIYLRLLLGQEGELLRTLVAQKGKLRRMEEALLWFRQNAFRHVRAKELARRAHMSEPSMFTAFKALTSMSPLQFQKQLRLHEARRLLLAEEGDIALISQRVGYKSPSQFSREYSRFFDKSPKRDIQRLQDQESRHIGLVSRSAIIAVENNFDYVGLSS